MISFKQLIELQNNIPNDLIIVGFKRNTKIMFHKIDEKRTDINPKYNIEGFEEFQKEHWNNFFSGTEYIFSFWYGWQTARFLGCYKLGTPVIDAIIDEKNKSRRRYIFPEMKLIDFLSEYKNRLYINWTHPSANYGRWIDEDKYSIHSIKPSDDNSIGFIPSDHFKIRLEYIRIKKMMEYRLDNEEWYKYLTSRSGVYLIQDKLTGEQYIGSAYGENGFWGRWQSYCSKTDGNVRLKNKDYNNFQFCILWETLSTTKREIIINVETEMKLNLGTRVFGLNNN